VYLDNGFLIAQLSLFVIADFATQTSSEAYSSKAMTAINLAHLPPPDDNLLQQLDSSFNKKFSYRVQNTDWQLPANLFNCDNGLDSTVWSNDQLNTLKQNLNAVKSKLSALDIIAWQNHTQVIANLSCSS
jgi:hypothetical protein